MSKRLAFVALLFGTAICGCGGASGAGSRPPIAYTRCCSEILILNPDGSERTLTQGEGPHWSPDHRELVFTRADFESVPGPRSDAWLMRADGTGLKRLTAVTPPDQVRFLAFGGQPPRVAYDDNFGIWTIRPDGTGLRHVLRGHGWENELAIAPRGSTIAYTKNDTARSPALLGIVPLSGGPAQVVLRGTRHACGISSPTWSPDERWIAFALCVSKGGFDQEIGVWLVRPDGTGLHRLVAGGAEPIWSPDGEWIAFVAFEENSQESEELGALEAVRPDGSDRTLLTPRVRAEEVVESPSW